MSGNYDPDGDAKQTGTNGIRFLSNRDLSSQIPVNFVTHPGVYLTAACFNNGTFTAAIAEKCVSNLLASEFRRLVLDLYWDEQNEVFTFCPASIPVPVVSSFDTTSLKASSVTLGSLSGGNKLNIRQTSTSSSASSATPTVSGTTSGNGTSSTSSSPTTTTSHRPIATLPSINGETIYKLGPYACSSSLDFRLFVSVVSEYLSSTADSIDAKLLYLEFNLHAASSSNDPTAAAPEPSLFPSPTSLIGAKVVNIDPNPVYRPSDLETERQNLNSTWFKNPSNRWPIASYFTIDRLNNGDISTPDGWPDENYVQLTLTRRVFLTWGTIDPQMANYNFSGDSANVFPNRQLSAPRDFQANSAGQLTSGCFYRSSIPQTGLGSPNSSWAITSSETASYGSNQNLITNITSCGLSPVLNHSISGGPANQNIGPYAQIARAAIWNWASGEPRNTSAPGVDLDAPESQYRCAYLDAETSTGRWYVDDCLKHYQVACRSNNSPYQWTLSSDSAPYSSGPGICPENTSFSVPMTGLENTYLYQHILSVQQSSSGASSDPQRVWLNFNSLDLQGCWVITGPNGTCPYFEDPDAERSRQVLVPTIAAIIVLILTALTVFVKCNVNRRNSKHRRRGEGGWDYEGVPS